MSIEISLALWCHISSSVMSRTVVETEYHPIFGLNVIPYIDCKYTKFIALNWASLQFTPIVRTKSWPPIASILSFRIDRTLSVGLSWLMMLTCMYAVIAFRSSPFYLWCFSLWWALTSLNVKSRQFFLLKWIWVRLTIRWKSFSKSIVCSWSVSLRTLDSIMYCSELSSWSESGCVWRICLRDISSIFSKLRPVQSDSLICSRSKASFYLSW